MTYGVDFDINAQWGINFIGTIKVNNLTATDTSGWMLKFFAPFEISRIWDAEIVSRTGGHYVIRNDDWNATIAAKGSAVFGFEAEGVAAGLASRDFSVLDIATDTAPPALSVSSRSVSEGDAGTKSASFTVSLSEASRETVTVTYATADGTARAGSDYVARSGTLTFAPGQTKKSVTVGVIGDRRYEADESFALKLSRPTKATIAKAEGAGRILNDDAAPPHLSVSSRSVSEGDAGQDVREIHRVAVRGVARNRDRDVRDRGRHGQGGLGLRRAVGDADLRAGPDQEGRHGRRARRQALRGGRELRAEAVAADQGDDRQGRGRGPDPQRRRGAARPVGVLAQRFGRRRRARRPRVSPCRCPRRRAIP